MHDLLLSKSIEWISKMFMNEKEKLKLKMEC